MENSYLQTVYECFDARAIGNPDETALVYLGTEWSYGELHNLVQRLAAALDQLGIKPGERIIIYLPNIPQWLIAFLAVQRIRALPVALSAVSTSAELAAAIDSCQPDAIICTDTNFSYALQLQRVRKQAKIIVTNLTELLPLWKRCINKMMKLVPEGRTGKDEGVIAFGDLLSKSGQTPKAYEGKGDDVALLCFTSGTQGNPKALPYSNHSLLESISMLQTVSEATAPEGRAAVMLGRPLDECLSIITALSSLIRGGETLALAPENNIDALMAIVQRYKVTQFLGSPDLFRGILENPRRSDYNLTSLKYCFSGGDTLPVAIADGWRQTFDQPLYSTYCIAEACGPVSLCPPVESVPTGAAGKIADNRLVKFIDQDSSEEVAVGEAGEILVSSDKMVQSYWNIPDETQKAFIQLDGNLWFRSGDIGRVDENGWFYFLSRGTDIIKHQNHKIVAAEIERVLEDHPAVVRASVVGIPDPGVGERIKSFLVLKPGIQGITSYHLMEWCREKLPDYMVPQYIEFRDMLPTSKAGKLLKRELVLEEQEAQE